MSIHNYSSNKKKGASLYTVKNKYKLHKYLVYAKNFGLINFVVKLVFQAALIIKGCLVCGIHWQKGQDWPKSDTPKHD